MKARTRLMLLRLFGRGYERKVKWHWHSKYQNFDGKGQPIIDPVLGHNWIFRTLVRPKTDGQVKGKLAIKAKKKEKIYAINSNDIRENNPAL